jgi:hypothetical protein
LKGKIRRELQANQALLDKLLALPSSPNVDRAYNNIRIAGNCVLVPAKIFQLRTKKKMRRNPRQKRRTSLQSIFIYSMSTKRSKSFCLL